MTTLNEVYSSRSARRRYEVWFIRLGLADGTGAWWFRYLLLNLGRKGCDHTQDPRLDEPVRDPSRMPTQIWATWFPRDGKPQTFIQGFSQRDLALSARGRSPFHFASGGNKIEEDGCRGLLNVDGHQVSWNLRYRSTFQVTLSNKGWIGFSHTPHSDAVFAGDVTLDGHKFEGDPLGYGVQGHNCGYRHRGFWTWAHAHFTRRQGPPSTLEALTYDMPLGLLFRKAVLWHEAKSYVFENFGSIAKSFSASPAAPALRNPQELRWNFRSVSKDGMTIEVVFEGGGPSLHHLPYLKTNCSGSFDVMNNSLASAAIRLERDGVPIEQLETTNGAVLERAGAH